MALSKPQRIALLVVLTIIIAVSLLALSMRTIVPGMPDRVAFTPAPGQPRLILIDVEGYVVHPDLYQVPEGCRVYEALKRAGGVLAEADTENLNLAAIVHDGDRIYVAPRGRPPDYQPPAGVDTSSVGPAAVKGERRRPKEPQAPGAGFARPGDAPQPVDRIDINHASAEDLTRLPGIGEALASRIVQYRQANGSFRTLDDLERVPGIGQAKARRIEPYISF